MMPEDRAFRIVHRLLHPDMSFEQFERLITSQEHLEINKHIGFVAQEIRDAIGPYHERIDYMQERIDELMFEGEYAIEDQAFEADLIPL